MVHEDERVVGIDARVLGRRAEEVVGMRDHELVERRAGRHEDRRRPAAAPPGAAGLLPERGDRARIAGEHGDVEVADVDAELERVGRDDAEHLARRAAPARPRGGASAGSRRDSRARCRRRPSGRPRRCLIAVSRTSVASRLWAKTIVGDLLPEEAERELRRLAEIRRADPELGVDDRRVVADEELVARRARRSP